MSSRFHHSPATPADIPTLAQLFYTSFLTYDVWAASMRDVSEEGQLSFLTQILARRFDDPGALVTKAVEVETKKIVAWSTITAPTGGAEAGEKKTREPPLYPEKLDKEIWAIHARCAARSKEQGYNPETDFSRSGLIVSPEYQKQGLGLLLVSHDNALADAAGARTWTGASLNSKRLFEKSEVGFVCYGVEAVDLGDGEREGSVWLMVREPKIRSKEI